MLKWFGIIDPRPPQKFTGNFYLENKFHKKSRLTTPPPSNKEICYDESLQNKVRPFFINLYGNLQ